MTTAHRTNPATSGFSISPGEEWTSKAANWPVRIVSRETERGHFLTHFVPAGHADHDPEDCPAPPITQSVVVCGECDAGAFILCPDVSGEPYTVQFAQVLAGILAHLRRSHDG